MSTRYPSRHGACWVLQILLFIFALAHAGAAEPEPAVEREVPELQVPGVEALPPGVSPEPWTTWVTDQEVDSIPRISISLRLGLVKSLPRMAGSGPDAPKYTDINKTGSGLAPEFGYRLTPCISLGIQFLMIRMDGEQYDFDPADSEPAYDIDDQVVMGAGLSFTFALPLDYPWSNLFRFRRTEAPEGVSLYAKIGVGVRYDFGRQIEYPEGSAMAMGFNTSTRYHEVGANRMLSGGLGIEVRWVHFGLCIEFGYWDLGKPKPSNDPLWAQKSIAESLAVVSGMLGLGVHF